MRTGYERLIGIAVIMSVAAALLLAGAVTGPWQSGRVIYSSLAGHGPNAEAPAKAERGTDAWWNYCIASGELVYSVLSRESPAKTGLTNNRRIRFYERKKRIHVVSPEGEDVALTILRKDKAGKCP